MAGKWFRLCWSGSFDHKKRLIQSRKNTYFLYVFDSFPPFYSKRSDCLCQSLIFNPFYRLTGSIRSFKDRINLYITKNDWFDQKTDDRIPNTDVTLNWEKNMYFLYIFKGCTWNQICSLTCLKAKTEEKLICFPLVQIKNRFCHFLKKANFKFKLNFLWLLFDVRTYKEGFLCDMCASGWALRFFGIELLKNTWSRVMCM